MKTYIKLVLIFSLLLCGKAFAQADLAGTWQGKLSLNATDKMNIQFIITKEAIGSYKVMLNSPDSGNVKNEPAQNVQFKDSKLTLEVPALNGAYSGTMVKGVITGEWRQQGSNLPLILTRYQAPTAASLKPLEGSWIGKASPDPSVTLTVVLRFLTNKEGKFTGFADIPDQGAKDLPITDIALEKGQVNFKLPFARGEYRGTLSAAGITGSVKQAGQAQEIKLNLVKGTYVPPPPVVNIQPEAVKQLLGSWTGQVANIPLVIRFEQKAAGKITVLMDSPTQNAKDLPVSNTTFADGKLTLKVARVMGEYIGTLSGEKIDGTWTQGGKPVPLSLTKGAYVPPPLVVNIPPEAVKQLLGRWTGQIANIPTVIRFEQNAAGKIVVLMDSPTQNAKDLPVSSTTFADGKLTLKIASVMGEYAGTLNGETISGTWTQGGKPVPLTLTKEPAPAPKK